MPVQVVTEQNEQNEKKTITEKENEKWLRRYERNMCPADLYDEQVAPI